MYAAEQVIQNPDNRQEQENEFKRVKYHGETPLKDGMWNRSGSSAHFAEADDRYAEHDEADAGDFPHRDRFTENEKCADDRDDVRARLERIRDAERHFGQDEQPKDRGEPVHRQPRQDIRREEHLHDRQDR